MEELLIDYEELHQIKKHLRLYQDIGIEMLKTFIRNWELPIEELENRGFCCCGFDNEEKYEEIFWYGYCLRFHILPAIDVLHIPADIPWRIKRDRKWRRYFDEELYRYNRPIPDPRYNLFR